MTLLQEKDVQRDDVHFYVQTSEDGSCPASIFLPDLLSLQTKKCWDQQFLLMMGHPYDLARYDLRGSGCSSKPEDVLASTGQHFAEDLEAVMAALDLHRVVAVAAARETRSQEALHLVKDPDDIRQFALVGLLPDGQQVALDVQAVLAATREPLGERAHAALATLAVFPPKPNRFSREAACSVGCSAEKLDALDDAGLVESNGGGAFALHPTIAAYARIFAVPWRSAPQSGVAPALKGGAKPRC